MKPLISFRKKILDSYEDVYLNGQLEIDTNYKTIYCNNFFEFFLVIIKSNNIKERYNKMTNKSYLIESFDTSLFNASNFGDILMDLSEGTIDYIIENDAIDVIPFVKTVKSIVKGSLAIRDRQLLRKTAKFIISFNNKLVKLEKLNNYKKKLESNKFRANELERVLFLIDRFIDEQKSTILGNIYFFYINEDISYDEFLEMSDVLEKIFINDLNFMVQGYKNSDIFEFDNYFRLNLSYSSRLVSLGLVNIGSYFYDDSFYNEFYSKTELGQVICKFLK